MCVGERRAERKRKGLARAGKPPCCLPTWNAKAVMMRSSGTMPLGLTSRMSSAAEIL